MMGVGGPRRGGPSPFPSLEVGWRGKEMEVEVRGVPRDPPQSPVKARCRGLWVRLQSSSLRKNWRPGLFIPQQEETLAALLPGEWGWGTERAGIRCWPCQDFWLKQIARGRNKQQHVRSLQK